MPRNLWQTIKIMIDYHNDKQDQRQNSKGNLDPFTIFVLNTKFAKPACGSMALRTATTHFKNDLAVLSIIFKKKVVVVISIFNFTLRH